MCVCGGGGDSAWWSRYWNHTLPSLERLSRSPSEVRGRDEGCLARRNLNVSFIRIPNNLKTNRTSVKLINTGQSTSFGAYKFFNYFALLLYHTVTFDLCSSDLVLYTFKYLIDLDLLTFCVNF